MAGRSDEIETGMNTKINLVCTARLLLLKHVRLVLVIQEFDDGHPRVPVVYVVSETRCVDDGETHYTHVKLIVRLRRLHEL